MNEAIYQSLLAQGYILRDGQWHHPSTLVARLPDPKPEPDAGKKSLDIDQDEERGGRRIIFRITRYSRRLLDVDNLAGAKFLIDQCRYQNLIPDDSPDLIDLELRQVKVKTKAEEGVVIEAL